MTVHPGQLEQLLGGPVYVVQLGGVTVPAAALGPVTIRRGRADVDTAPAASQLTMTLRTDLLTAGPVKGTAVTVDLSAAALAFLGYRVNLHTGLTGADLDAGSSTGWTPSGTGSTLTLSTAAELQGVVDGQGLILAKGNVGTGTVTAIYAPTAKVPAAPGPITVGISVRRVGAAGTSEALTVVYRNAAGASLGSSTSAATTAAVGVTRRVVATGTAPAGTTNVTVQLAAAGTVGITGSVHLDGLTIEQGATSGTWFSWSSSGDRARAVHRFVGRVTDLAATPSSRRQLEPRLEVTAVGRRARAEVTVGDTPWPAEPATDRAGRILATAVAKRPELAGYVLSADPGPTVLARDVDRQSAAQLLDALAADADAELVEWADGSLRWVTALDRRGGHRDGGSCTLTGDTILTPSSFRQSATGMVNDLRVAYGPPAPTDQAVVEVIDQPAADDDLVDATQTTQLSTLADALALARSVVGRRSRPRWRIQGLALDAAVLSVQQLRELLAVQPGAGLVRVRQLPTSGPYTDARLFLEGYTETATRDRWQLDLDVSEYGLTAPAPRFRDVPGYTATAPAGQVAAWSWRHQRMEWPDGTPATAPAPGPTAGPTCRTVDPTLTCLAAAGWDPDPLA